MNGEGTIGKIRNQGTNDPAEGSRFRTFRTISENPRFMLFHLGWWGWWGFIISCILYSRNRICMFMYEYEISVFPDLHDSTLIDNNLYSINHLYHIHYPGVIINMLSPPPHIAVLKLPPPFHNLICNFSKIYYVALFP